MEFREMLIIRDSATRENEIEDILCFKSSDDRQRAHKIICGITANCSWDLLDIYEALNDTDIEYDGAISMQEIYI
jgi:hypothetical protein